MCSKFKYNKVGIIGGGQDLSLGGGCVDPDTAAHELLHAMGFNHEHQRPVNNRFD